MIVRIKRVERRFSMSANLPNRFEVRMDTAVCSWR